MNDLCDEQDASLRAAFPWRVNSKGYLVRTLNLSNPRRTETVYFHREILGFPAGVVDHVNRNPLDNRRENLRITSHRNNRLNTDTPFIAGRSGVVGVLKKPRRGFGWRYIACARVNGVRYQTSHASLDDAVKGRLALLRAKGIEV